jgi:uncharacterized circularly permuted ATP-grasp superfamily protein/uncharacterized alpha-E superfamily protein
LTQASFQFDGSLDPELTAARVALGARPGHYDELRAEDGALRETWRQFFRHLGGSGFAELGRRRAASERRIRDDGVTYNVYSDTGTSQRPWSLNLLPFIISAPEWSRLEEGIVQRAALLSAIMEDVYGPQRLLAEGLLPPALVLGNPGYLRPLAGCVPPGGTFLYIVALDLSRDADGAWWVVSQRTQAPSGIGYALQNRLITRQMFPDAFREMRVQHLATSYRRLVDTMMRLAPHAPGATGYPRSVLLTAGPYSETYFEHAYLARYLGIPLVEGSDLTVRDDRVFLKTLHGLQPVHAILRRLDDDFCDPLELRPDSALGVPALLQAIRAGGVLVANAIGSGFLESPALNGFLPAIAQRLLGAELTLPSLPSWWCGERAAYAQVRDRLAEKVIKPTYPHTPYRPGFEAMIGAELDDAQRAYLRQRIDADPDAYTVQTYLPLSQTATWKDDMIVPRSAMVRVFAIADGQGHWHAMPGGLTRVAARDLRVVSMQRGGSSADTWVMTDGPVDSFSMLPEPLRPQDIASQRRIVTSRAAENLYWMGRYTERAEFSVRLARAIISRLGNDEDDAPAVLETMGRLAAQHGLVPRGVPSPAHSPQGAIVFERTMQAELTVANGVAGVEYDLTALTRSASQIRERLSAEHWRLLVDTARGFRDDCARLHVDGGYSADEMLAVLAHLAVQLAAITGAQMDRMTRDDGWRLLAIGRHIERLGALARALQVLIDCNALSHEQGFELALDLFDSTITYRAMYQSRVELPPLIDLLVINIYNPRALAGVVRRMTREMQRLPAAAAAELLAQVPALETWPPLADLCAPDEAGRLTTLLGFLGRLSAGADALSDGVGERFFTHAADRLRLLNA